MLCKPNPAIEGVLAKNFFDAIVFFLVIQNELNLITWTNYTGFDPEVTSGNDFNFRVDGFRYPNFRRISGQVDIRF